MPNDNEIKPSAPVISIEDARKAILEQTQARERECWFQIEQILSKYSCQLSPVIVLKPSGAEYGINCTSK